MRTDITVVFGVPILIGALAFGITGRLVSHSVTNANLASVRETIRRAMNESPKEMEAGYKRLQVQLEQRIALSSARRGWDNVASVALSVTMLSAGATALVLLRRNRHPSGPNTDAGNPVSG
jgi:hypothetical protein